VRQYNISRHLLARSSSFALLVALAAPPVSANDDDPSEQRERITVIGERDGSLTTDTPDEARAKADRIAGAASVLDLADTEGRRNATLADVLRLAPGVFAAPRFGQEDLRLSVRGSGISRTGHAKGVLVIRDGVPVNAADGNFDPPALDLEAGSHLSILRGYSALGVGATTLGGALVLESRTGRNSEGVRAAIDGGSFGTWRVAGSAGVAGEIVDGFIAVSRSAHDGFREQAETDALRLSGNVGWQVAPGLETRLFAGHAEIDSLWPGVLTRAEFEANPRQASLVALRRDQDNNIRQSFVSSRTAYSTGIHRVTLALGYDDRFKDHATPNGILLESNQSVTGSLVYELGSSSDPLARPFTIGVRAMNTDQQAETIGYAGPLNSAVSSQPGALSASRDRRARNLELFTRGELPLTENLVASASLAAVWTDRRDGSGPGDPLTAPPAYDISYDDVLPGVGLIWQPRGDIMVFGGWSQTFEAPSFFDLGGNVPLQADRLPRLRAQNADTFELGTRGRSGGLAWDVTLFHSRIDGELLRLDAAGALNPPIVNANKTTRTGLEAAISYDLASLLGGEAGANLISAKWDWLDARFDDDPVYGNRRVAGVPEHNAYIELQVQPVSGFVLRPNLTIRSRTETDMFNTAGQAAEGFVLAGLSARYDLGKVALWVDGRNLTDRRWVSAVNVVNRSIATSALFFPGDGRSVFAGVTLAL
jgi:iron complex outermembrane receptor protein